MWPDDLTKVLAPLRAGFERVDLDKDVTYFCTTHCYLLSESGWSNPTKHIRLPSVPDTRELQHPRRDPRFAQSLPVPGGLGGNRARYHV
jgi:hypothetical protein